MRHTNAACLWWPTRTARKRFVAGCSLALIVLSTRVLATAPEYPADVIALIRERTAKMSLGPLFWTPTVQGLLNYEYVRDNPEQLDDPSWQVGLPQSIIDDIKPR